MERHKSAATAASERIIIFFVVRVAYFNGSFLKFLKQNSRVKVREKIRKRTSEKIKRGILYLILSRSCSPCDRTAFLISTDLDIVIISPTAAFVVGGGGVSTSQFTKE